VLCGCSAKGLKTHPVQGKVELKDGDIAILTGSYVELMQEADPLVRASGRITAQGSYAIQTLHEGKVLSGAPDGKYKVRIVLGDESDEGVPKRKGNPFHPRYLDFDKSGLSFTVPSGDYSVVLSKK
jgi:hypothetical protein